MYDDTKPYGGRYGDWKAGDRFSEFGTTWTVTKVSRDGRRITATRNVTDTFGKDYPVVKEFPLTSMGYMKKE